MLLEWAVIGGEVRALREVCSMGTLETIMRMEDPVQGVT